ncbi:MAG: protein phosphatase 2C domain-containing protein [Cyanobacteriota bacterium]
MLYCSNYSCQAPNSEYSKFCQTCRTPLTKRYLWAIGPAAELCRVDELLANRYLVKGRRVLLDTKPGLLPGISTEQIPDELLPYLRLSPYALHVPQVYDWVRLESAGGPEKLALLERSPLYLPNPPSEADPTASAPQVFPSLTDLWPRSSALRQLNWLWQIAHLWQPFATEQVVSSLLMPDLLRVEGPLVRLIELQVDASGIDPTLADLGGLWQQWLPTAHAKVLPHLDPLCQEMIRGQLYSSEQVIERLDKALWTVAQAAPRQVSLATRTDQGPSRQRNEDACYPPSGTVQAIALTPTTIPLLIVCDGIGGHQGGDVASNLAIAAVQQRLQTSDLSGLSPSALMQELEAAACAANDVISQRNDEEHRQDRQRMGTTLVMALVRGHELYLAHVGDSRAYWITPWNCHQITQDDDVASREVRMGYSFYREALQHVSSGSLVQALGMSSSTLLHANVQRFVLDEDSLFLLCSDGLSDNDRVEQYWDLELLPVLSGRANLEMVTQRLVDLANSQNGHDNVTVGIIHVQLPSLSPTKLAPTQLPGAEAAPVPTAIAPTAVVSPVASSATPTQASKTPPSFAPPSAESALPKTQVASPVAAKPSPLPLVLTILALIGAGALGYGLMRDRLTGLTGFPPLPSESLSPEEDPAIALQPGAFILIGRAADGVPSETSGLILQPSLPPVGSHSTASPNPATATTPDLAVTKSIAPGSVLMVLDRHPLDTPTLIKLRVCSIQQAIAPTPTPAALPASRPALNPISPDSGSASSANSALSTSPTGDLPAPSPPPAPNASPSDQSAIAAPGAEGWVTLTDLRPLMMPNPTLTDAQRGICAPPSTPTPDLPASPPAPPPSGPTTPPSASPDASPGGVG